MNKYTHSRKGGREGERTRERSIFKKEKCSSVRGWVLIVV